MAADGTPVASDADPWNALVGPLYDEPAIRVLFKGEVPWADLVRTTTADGECLFPAFQFDGGGPLPPVAEIIGILRPQLDEWSVAQWLNTRIDVYRGRSAAEMLRAGEVNAVLLHAHREIARCAN